MNEFYSVGAFLMIVRRARFGNVDVFVLMISM